MGGWMLGVDNGQGGAIFDQSRHECGSVVQRDDRNIHLNFQQSSNGVAVAEADDGSMHRFYPKLNY